MRLVYTADLHGDIESYRSLLELAVTTGARAAIVGGDLLPHAIRLGSALHIQREFIEAALRPLLADFRAAHPEVAIYLLAGNDDWAGAIAALGELERDGLAFPLHERVYRLSTNDHRRPTTDQRRPTNDQRPTTTDDSVTGRQGDGAMDDDRLGPSPAHPLTPSPDELWLAGYACVPLTPFSIKDYERRDDGPLPAFSFGMAYASWEGEIRPVEAGEIAASPSIAEALAELARQSNPRRTIYVCHTPPASTPLDAMPRGRHIGSKALRVFIERHVPLLTLHGHVHEAPQESGHYAVQIGATWSANPGHDQRRFHAIALDTDDVGATMTHTVFGRP
jgi:Icc-related predicted phosphoesterase